MKNELKNKGLFTTYQVAKACSVSRSTILRLEAEGLAVPSIRDDSTGSRLYTSKDISRIMELLSLQSLGFTREDLRHFYTTSYGYSANIQALEAKVALMSGILEKLKDRGDTSRHNVVFEKMLPSQCFYIKTLVHEPSPKYLSAFLRDTYTEAISQGYSIDWQMSTCLLISDLHIKDRNGSMTPMHFNACVPLPADSQGENILYAPKHRALCMLVVQTPNNIVHALISLEEEATSKGYEIIAPFCIYTLEDYYPSDPDDDTKHVAQVSLPIRKPGDPIDWD